MFIGLISKLYKELKKLDINNPSNHINKWGTDLNRESQQKNLKWPRNTYGDFNILSHQGNTSQNDSKIPPYTCENGQDHNHKRQLILEKMCGVGGSSSMWCFL